MMRLPRSTVETLAGLSVMVAPSTPRLLMI